ncbi:MAG: transcription antitermination factor NusB [Caldimicrobium sp.]
MLRRKGREIALQILYQIEIAKISLSEALQNYKNYLNIEGDLKAFSFAEELLQGIAKQKDFLDALIQKYTQNWPLDRLNLTDKNILRIALYEFFFRPDIPPVVSINEAVELAKLYGTDESPAFINGILDRIYKNELEKERKHLSN